MPQQFTPQQWFWMNMMSQLTGQNIPPFEEPTPIPGTELPTDVLTAPEATPTPSPSATPSATPTDYGFLPSAPSTFATGGDTTPIPSSIATGADPFPTPGAVDIPTPGAVDPSTVGMWTGEAPAPTPSPDYLPTGTGTYYDPGWATPTPSPTATPIDTTPLAYNLPPNPFAGAAPPDPGTIGAIPGGDVPLTDVAPAAISGDTTPAPSQAAPAPTDAVTPSAIAGDRTPVDLSGIDLNVPFGGESLPGPNITPVQGIPGSPGGFAGGGDVSGGTLVGGLSVVGGGNIGPLGGGGGGTLGSFGNFIGSKNPYNSKVPLTQDQWGQWKAWIQPLTQFAQAEKYPVIDPKTGFVTGYRNYTVDMSYQKYLSDWRNTQAMLAAEAQMPQAPPPAPGDVPPASQVNVEGALHAGQQIKPV